MANFVSPGVYTIEKDVSDYAPSVNPSIVGLVGFASRGPVDTPTLLTSPADLIRQFGTPDLVTGGQGIYGALEILQKTNQVYYVRAATTQKNDARATIGLATHAHAKLDVGEMNKDFVYRFDVNTTDKLGNADGDQTSFYAYRERPAVSGVAGGSVMPTTDVNSWSVVDWHNAVLAGIGEVYDAERGQINYIPSAYNSNDGMIVSRQAGATASTASRIQITTYVASADSEGAIAYSGTYLSATPIDVSDLTFVPLVSQTNALAASSQALFSAPTDDDTSYLTASGNLDYTGGQGQASGVSFAIYNDSVNAPGAYQVNSLYPGLGYNYSAVNYGGTLQYRGLQAEVVNTNDLGRFVLNIASDGGTEESYDMGLFKPTFITSATSLWPEAVLNQGLTNVVSQYVKGNFYEYKSDGVVSGINTWTPPVNFGDAATGLELMAYVNGRGAMANGAADATFRCLTLDGNTSPYPNYDLSGGKNGDAKDYNGNISNSNVRAALIGQSGNKTGINALDSEDVPITMASVPGITDQSVQNELISLAESTQNFLAVVAPPVGFRSAQQAVAWTNGKATGRTASINSSYGAVYWPWVKSFDAYTGSDKWFDPSIYAIGQMAFTDEVSDPWFAPAGLRRGRLTTPTDVEVALNQGDRDALYGPGNIVNPITKFQSDGIVIYGQRTAQRQSTALDRVNVRRLMIFLRRLVLQGARRFVFEPNDPITWESVRNVLSPALADIQQRRGITQFKVVCDATTNTPLRVDRNELWCKVILKPTKTAEILVFELNLTNQSASV